ncbi:MAG: sugar ABC transporter ATP-binding protein [Bacteroidia bacterium]|nr:sugar ABC transporter ATP-binding protein [Bacteroidia bacterium]
MSNEYVVEMKNITKSFPGVKALDDVSFHLKSGQVMALLGENGAGKSTLMKILSGIYSRDAGTIRVFGNDIKGNITPKIAQELGVAIIHQELNMCSHLTVAENIFLGKEIHSKGLLKDREMLKRAHSVLDRLKIDIQPTSVVGDLAVGQQQMVEIAKALESNAKVLIMDEPTSALTSKEIEELFRIIREIKADGCGIVYISHRLEELQHIVDAVTIMRDGRYINEGVFKELTLKQIISDMVGREIKEQFPRVDTVRGNKIFSVRNLNAGRMVRDVSFEAYEGEILGIAGLMGSGRTETTRAVFGVDPKESGEIYLQGEKIEIHCPMDAIRHGLVLAPEDRKKDGLCTKLSVRENIALANLDELCEKGGIVNRKKEREIVNTAISNLKIKLPSAEVNAASLSGGNQQKVVVAKWLARNSKVVIFDEPTRGIDVAAKVEIYNIMNTLKQNGIAVIFVSSEMPEVLGIADRIVVMCDGRVTGSLKAKETTQEEILSYATMFEKKID